MPENLFAACRVDGGLAFKRVRLAADVQQTVEDFFQDQENDFRQDVTAEVDFDGFWTPDDDQFLTTPVTAEAEAFVNIIHGNALAVDNIDVNALEEQRIKALFTGGTANGNTTVLVQQFMRHQILARKFSLLLDGEVFQRMSDAAFTLNTSLTCIIENGLIKFKSYHKLRSIMDMSGVYQEATNEEVETFATHQNLEVNDPAAFAESLNEGSRKLVHAVMRNDVLGNYQPEAIQRAAQETGLPVEVNNGRLVMPQDAGDVRALLQFLNESRYLGPLSGQTYVTNSRRRV